MNTKTFWNYQSSNEKSSGYEDEILNLKKYTKSRYDCADQSGKDAMVDEVFNIYRNKNIFPITYYNPEGIRNEIKSVIGKDVDWDYNTDVLDLRYNQGQSLCRFMFPNMQDVVVNGDKRGQPYKKFHNDHNLKRAIKFCLDHKKSKVPVLPTGIKDGLEMLGGNSATNFKTMNAKALYQHFCNEGDIVLDYSAGFGGRMLAAMSLGLRYVGIDPSEDTCNNLNMLGTYISEVNDSKFFIHKRGSEENFPTCWSQKVDFAFSSPPYFDLEVYSDEETQCYNKFNTLDEWFDGYVRPTIKNIFNSLKSGKYYAVNIADFKSGGKEVDYVSEWIKISKEEGFVYEKQVFMKLQARRGVGHDKSNNKTKKEGIFIFRKP